ncbi:hypothetical protein [uncultured Bacteroides sp.]|uniref:hypothetical protein n=1 Tax=uncultured Bacteroides sp. TaxID=162156 RepID=UPI0025F065EF|nr:hypothetical protein [uncultured Bacteroides sp.]
MSELNFDILNNDADFVQKAARIRGAIGDLGTEFVTLSTQTEIGTKNMKEFIDVLKAQIDTVIGTLQKVNSENQSQVWSLQTNMGDTATVADADSGNIQSELSVRKELTVEIQQQLNEMDELKNKLLEYEQEVRRTQEVQTSFTSRLKGAKEGLDGVSGALSVVMETMSMFGVENENLQRIMQKVQVATEITNGLQAVSAALNKDSAFQLNVLGRMKLWWRNITMQAAAAQGVETAAASAGTVVNLGLAGAFRAVGLAIKSIPVFGWIAAGISALIGIYSLWSSSTDKQAKKQEKLAKGMDEFNSSIHNYAAKPVASIELLSYKFKALGNNIEAQKKFVYDNKRAFDELGLSILNVKDAQQLLIENKDNFINAQIAKATSLAYGNFVEEEAKKFIDAKREHDFWQNKVDAKQEKFGEKKNNEDNVDRNFVLQNDNFTSETDNLSVRKFEKAEILDPDQVQAEHFERLVEKHKANMQYGIESANSYLEQFFKLMPAETKDDGAAGRENRLEQLQNRIKGISESEANKRRQQAVELEQANCQAEINARDEGFDKKIAQMLFNHDLELEELEREKKTLLEQRVKAAEEMFNAAEDVEMAKDPKRERRTFDPTQVELTKEEVEAFGNRESNIIKKQNREIQAAFDAEKQAMNEQLAALGNYEQKRQAIIALGESKKKGKSKGEQDTIDKETNKALSNLDKEANKEKSAFDKLFLNMKNKSVKEMRDIVKSAQKELHFVESGNWDEQTGEKLGISEITFNELRNSSKELEDIKDKIKEVEDQTNQCDTAFNQMAIGFDKLFKAGSDSKKLTESLSLIETGLNRAMQAGKFLSGALSNLGAAFGSDALGKAAEGINVAMDAAGNAMSGAKAGAMFGPWGAAAGAAVGLVSSLASSLTKLHDGRHEKSIKKIQEQIEVLEKSYSDMSDSLEKAYSSDASQLIEQQNTLLGQQKVLIQNQIAEERSKKNADAGRIKEWENRIKDIDKLIGENKEKQIDAILGSDVKSAIDDFAQAYADAWSAGNDRAKSSKDLVKQMIKQMVMEAMKATTSDKMEALRNKLAGFFSDGIIDSWEREQIEKNAEAITKELDRKYGWADEYMKGEEKESASQAATSGGFETMSQETGSELNGRFTALQVSNEEIRNSMLLALGNLSVLCTTASDGNILLSEVRNLALMSNSHLEDIARYTKPILGFGEKLDKIERNTANL